MTYRYNSQLQSEATSQPEQPEGQFFRFDGVTKS